MNRFYLSGFGHWFVLLVGNTGCYLGFYIHKEKQLERTICFVIIVYQVIIITIQPKIEGSFVNNIILWTPWMNETRFQLEHVMEKVQPNQDFTLYFQGLWMSIEYEVLYVLATRIRFMCPMNFNRFPMDQQMCKFQVMYFFLALYYLYCIASINIQFY